MSNRSTLSIFTALAAIVSGACNDSTTEPDNSLSPEESQAIFAAISENFFTSDQPVDPISVTPNGAVYPCPLGGQATASLENTEEVTPETARQTTSIVFDPDACELPSASGQFTLDGSPSLQLELTVTVALATMQASIDGSVGGGLDWQLGDRSGTCMVQMTYSVQAGQPDTAEIMGTACGRGPPFPFGESVLRRIATNFGSGG